MLAIVEPSEQSLPASATPHGGGSVPPVEIRVARVEVRIEHIERDIAEIKVDIRSLRQTELRLVCGAIIASNLGLAGLMAKGFGWL